MTSNEDVREDSAEMADEGSDVQPMAEPGHEGLLTGPIGGGAWTSAWSVPVGLAWQEVVANNQQGQDAVAATDEAAARDSPESAGEPEAG